MKSEHNQTDCASQIFARCISVGFQLQKPSCPATPTLNFPEPLLRHHYCNIRLLRPGGRGLGLKPLLHDHAARAKLLAATAEATGHFLRGEWPPPVYAPSTPARSPMAIGGGVTEASNGNLWCGRRRAAHAS